MNSTYFGTNCSPSNISGYSYQKFAVPNDSPLEKYQCVNRVTSVIVYTQGKSFPISVKALTTGKPDLDGSCNPFRGDSSYTSTCDWQTSNPVYELKFDAPLTAALPFANKSYIILHNYDDPYCKNASDAETFIFDSCYQQSGSTMVQWRYDGL